MASIFTRIIQGEIPGRIIWSDDVCIGMLDIRPLHPGHVLVIPREEVDHWLDLDDETTQHLNAVAKHIGKAQQSVVECVRIGLMIAGFEVPHTHLHVIPLQTMENLDFRNAETSPRADLLDAMADSLRSALGEAGHSGSVPTT